MALTKLQFYTTVILIVVVLGTMFMTFGKDALNHSKANLDDNSEDYINSYSGYIEEAQFDSINGSTADQQEESLTGNDNETTSFSITDVLGATNFYNSRIGKITGTIKLIYNVPSFIFASLGVPLQPFSIITNGINAIVYIGLIVLIVRLIRGS